MNHVVAMNDLSFSLSHFQKPLLLLRVTADLEPFPRNAGRETRTLLTANDRAFHLFLLISHPPCLLHISSIRLIGERRSKKNKHVLRLLSQDRADNGRKRVFLQTLMTLMTAVL